MFEKLFMVCVVGCLLLASLVGDQGMLYTQESPAEAAASGSWPKPSTTARDWSRDIGEWLAEFHAEQNRKILKAKQEGLKRTITRYSDLVLDLSRKKNLDLRGIELIETRIQSALNAGEITYVMLGLDYSMLQENLHLARVRAWRSEFDQLDNPMLKREEVEQIREMILGLVAQGETTWDELERSEQLFNRVTSRECRFNIGCI